MKSMLNYKPNQANQLPGIKSPYRKQIIEIAKLAKYQPVPSIPALNDGFNFTLIQDGHIRKKIKNTACPTPPKIHEERKSPANARFPRLQTKISRLQPTSVSQSNENYLTVDTRIETEEQLIFGNKASSSTLCKPENKNRRNKASLRYKVRRSSNELEEQSEQQTDEQYSTNATPGPGHYSSADSPMISNTTKRGLTDFSFGSRASRFSYANQQQNSPQKPTPSKQIDQAPRQNPKIRFRRKIVPFLSNSLKTVEKVESIGPSPQDYFVRNGIEQELIKKIQRNFKGSFGVCEKRFKPLQKDQSIGPGSYLSVLPHEGDSHLAGSYFFTSNKSRF